MTTTPAEFEQVHQAFIETYNTTAHEGLLKDQLHPPIPLQVLGEAKGRMYTPEELARQFSRALFPRTTNQYGCVTLHSYHFYVELRHEVARLIVWQVVPTRPVVPSTVSYEVRQQGNALSKAL